MGGKDLPLLSFLMPSSFGAGLSHRAEQTLKIQEWGPGPRPGSTTSKKRCNDPRPSALRKDPRSSTPVGAVRSDLGRNGPTGEFPDRCGHWSWAFSEIISRTGSSGSRLASTPDTILSVRSALQTLLVQIGDYFTIPHGRRLRWLPTPAKGQFLQPTMWRLYYQPALRIELRG